MGDLGLVEGRKGLTKVGRYEQVVVSDEHLTALSVIAESSMVLLKRGDQMSWIMARYRSCWNPLVIINLRGRIEVS